MKARIKASALASKKEIQKAREVVSEELRRQGGELTRRVFKLFCLCLNERFQFGKGRLGLVLGDVERLSKEHETDEVFWSHIDKRMEQIGMEFIKEKYDEVDR
jgi:hypothetical protein